MICQHLFLNPIYDAVNLPPCSETRTIHVSNDDTIEERPIEPGLTNNVNASTNLDSLAEIDPLTGEEAAIYNDNGEVAHIREPPNILSHSKTSAGTSTFYINAIYNHSLYSF